MDYKRLNNAKQAISLNLELKANIKKVLQYHYLGFLPDKEFHELKLRHPKLVDECVKEINSDLNKQMGLLN